MTGSPEVSVVMGVYNGGRYLRASIESILTQRGADFEFVIVDDGSTDGTAQILADFAQRDARIRVLRRTNSGLTRSLIVGCDAARGRFIARQDADDLSAPDRLMIQAQMLREDPALGFVSSWAEDIGPDDEPLLRHKRPGTREAATHLLMYGRSGPWHGSVMMRADAYHKVGGYRAKFYFAQDADLWLRLGAIAGLNYAQQVLYRYRISAESISGSLHERKLPYAHLIDQIHGARLRGEDDAPLLAAAQLPGPGSASRFRSSADRANYFIGRCLVGRRDPRARRYLRLAVAGNPRNLRALVMWCLAECAAPFWNANGKPLS